RPGVRFDADGSPDVSVEVVEVAGAGDKGAAVLGVTAAHRGDTTLITLTARGAEPVRWSASTGAPWLYLSRSSGTLAPGESVTIRVHVDQLREPSGHWRATVAVSPAGSLVSIEGYGPARSAPVSGSPSTPGTPGVPPPSPSHPDPTPPSPTPSDPAPADPPSSSAPDPDPSPADPAPSDPPPSGPSPSGPSPSGPSPSDPEPADPSDSAPAGTGTPDPGTS
ncbi:hypothetical protein AB0450_33195, partial [Streptomyces sp. NPDC093808]